MKNTLLILVLGLFAVGCEDVCEGVCDEECLDYKW